MEDPITLAIFAAALVVAFVVGTQAQRSSKGPNRVLYFVIEIAEPLGNGTRYWSRDPDRQVFKALDAQEACDSFARSVPLVDERADRRIRRINRDEFQELGGIV